MLMRGGRWGSSSGCRDRASRRIQRPQHEPLDDDHNYVCIVQSEQTLGVAVYRIDSCEILVTEIEADDNFSGACKAKNACSPCTIIATKTMAQNPNFVRALTGNSTETNVLTLATETDDTRFHAIPISQTETENGIVSKVQNEDSSRIGVVLSSSNEDDSNESCGVQRFIRTVPAAECTIHKATETISMISVLSMPENCRTAKERVSFLTHIFDGYSIALRATGGLLAFCLGNNILLARDGEDTVCINSIKHGSLGFDGMLISTTSAFALQIFQQDLHPAGRGVGKLKEWGIFGILSAELKSRVSMNTLRSWMRNPLIDVREIVDRQLVVTAFRSPANQNFVYSIREGLKKVKNIPQVLARIRNFSASVPEWSSLYTSTQSFIGILDSFKNMGRNDKNLMNLSFLERVRDIDTENLRQIVSYIEECIDFAECKLENRLVILPGFNKEVDEMRESLASIDSWLTEVGKQEMRRMIQEKPGGVELSSMIFHFESNIGYTVHIEDSDVNRFGMQRLKNAGFEFHHSNGHEQLFKNEKCRELDDEVGDIRGSLVSLETKVVRYLEYKVSLIAETAYDAARIVSEIDCLQAMGNAAEEYKWIRPTVSTEAAGIHIENGRHCLLDIGTLNFVPNSTSIRLGDVNVVTGPNQAGKSVLLKQIALIVFLAQIGSCVPADSATIYPVSGIFTRILSFDTISKGRSSFFADCAQVAGMLQTEKKVVLSILDEFGKGTSVFDGVSIFAAVLRSIIRRGDKSVMCLCATHQIEIFDNNILPLDSPALRTYAMEMVAAEEYESSKKAQKINCSDSPSETNFVDNETKFVRTYRLLQKSICSESRAVQCAVEKGVRRETLRQAMHIKEKATISAPSSELDDNESAKDTDVVHLSIRRLSLKEDSNRSMRFISFHGR